MITANIASHNVLKAEIDSGRLDEHFVSLYGQDKCDMQKLRYLQLLSQLLQDRPGVQAMFVNAPGRTELGGNHTDHQNGCVLAAAVDLDCVAAIAPVDTAEVTLLSEEYPQGVTVDLTNLDPNPDELGKPEALVRGMAAAFFNRTGCRRGFFGRIHATCLPGTGLSSSAAFSVLIGASFNFLYNNNLLTAQELARMAKDAENNFFGKPCGLMDQMASAIGHTIFIDFVEPEKPNVERIIHSLAGTGYRLAIIDTGGSHIGLTDEYAAIPKEMQAAAQVLDKSYGRGINLEQLLDSIGEIRQQAGDRAALRLLHFIEENDRAQTMAQLLREGRFARYLQNVEASGISSCCLLQNCATATSSREQGILMALAMSRHICAKAVCRVHGGGFAGTVQAYVPDEEYENYCSSMAKIFGAGSVLEIQIGRPGVCGLTNDGLILPFPN